jgi:hypothetical protein
MKCRVNFNEDKRFIAHPIWRPEKDSPVIDRWIELSILSKSIQLAVREKLITTEYGPITRNVFSYVGVENTLPTDDEAKHPDTYPYRTFCRGIVDGYITGPIALRALYHIFKELEPTWMQTYFPDHWASELKMQTLHVTDQFKDQ